MIAPRALTHAVELVRRPSVTPADGGCQDYLENVLAPLGFERRRMDAGGVSNSVYTRAGERHGMLAFAGHTDVVPAGPESAWPHPPFAAAIENGCLHGRGTQDMKGAIACWLASIEALLQRQQPLPGIQLLITSDEEGESVDGTVRIVEQLQAGDELPDAALVGEPSSSRQVGDTVRRGRRGIVVITLEFKGSQGHSAYPEDADNAVHHAAPVLARIAAINWGANHPDFPATTCQITNVQAGTGASNVIPGTCRAVVDIRYNPAMNFADIERNIRTACADANVGFTFQHQGAPFYTRDGPWLQLVLASIERVTGKKALGDTGGGTSDGRFLAAAGVPVVELGLTNDTIHQVGERVAVSELEVLTRIYTDIIENFER